MNAPKYYNMYSPGSNPQCSKKEPDSSPVPLNTVLLYKLLNSGADISAGWRTGADQIAA